MINEPEYWRITDAVEKVIARHTYLWNCEQIINKVRKNDSLFMLPIYMSQTAAESAKFTAAIRHSSKPKQDTELITVYDIRGSGNAVISADDLRHLFS